MKTIKASRLAIALGAVAVLGVIAASAASLGGLTSTKLGANDTVVAPCDSDGVSIAYTTSYSATTSKYMVTSITLSGIAAGCVGETASVTLGGSGGTSLGTGSVTVAGTSETIAITPNAAAESVVGAAVVISG